MRDVYFGGLFQHANPLDVALVAFGLSTVGFLPFALARDRGGVAMLVRRPARLVWINVTKAPAWLSFLFALGAVEPALVQVLFYGIGPLSVRWVDGLIPGSPSTTPTPVERRLHLGLSSSLAVAGAVVLGGLSGLGPQPIASAALGVALAAGGGIAISISTMLCRTLNDTGVRPATLFALRFPGAIGLAAVFALVSPAPLLSGITPGLLGAVVLACLLLIVLPYYVNQVGVALASPVTVRTVLAVGPVLVFGLQLFDGRLSSSRATLVACVLYGVCAVVSANARRHTIGAMVGLSGTPAASRSGPCYHGQRGGHDPAHRPESRSRHHRGTADPGRPERPVDGAEHREILKSVLRPLRRRPSLKESLARMPPVGTDRDFARPRSRARRAPL